jgi:hypothetical protein
MVSAMAAPSTTLRVVPLPRFAVEDSGDLGEKSPTKFVKVLGKRSLNAGFKAGSGVGG